jgi:hypothetical protein
VGVVKQAAMRSTSANAGQDSKQLSGDVSNGWARMYNAPIAMTAAQRRS